MTQTRRMSLVETLAGVAIGFVVSMLLAMIIYPVFGHAFTFGQNAAITAIFTVASIVRGYAVRRLFVWIGGCRT